MSRFVEQADAVIADARRRGVLLIATGGTPLAYQALFEGLFVGPGADPAVRARLRAEAADRLHARLAEVDPAAAERIHLNDTKRLIRALEVYELTGRPISSFQTAWAEASRRHDAEWFGLVWDREALNRRINARVKQMIAMGWLDEVRGLMQRHGSLSQTASEAAGYRELMACARGEVSLEDAVEQIKISTRQLARRQTKWFRRFEQVQWLAGEDDPAVLADQIIQTVSPG